jgi:hypothetical protein
LENVTRTSLLTVAIRNKLGRIGRNEFRCRQLLEWPKDPVGSVNDQIIRYLLHQIPHERQ